MTERAKFYLLFSLFHIYERWDREDDILMLSFPDGFVNIMTACLHMQATQHNIQRRDVDLVLPGMLRENLIIDKKAQFEPVYQITVEGMKEYLKMTPQFHNERIDRAEELIKDLERRSKIESVQVSKSDSQIVLYYLYEQYREVESNRLMFTENFKSVAVISAYLKAIQKNLTLPIEQVLQRLDIDRLVRRLVSGKGEIFYRISQTGIKFIEQELDKQHSQLTLSIQKGEWERPKIKPMIESFAENSTSVKSAVQSPASDSMKPIGKFFISHAVKNKALSVAFTEKILETGLRVHQDEVFNISVEGQGIVSGEDFKKHIEKEIRTAKAIILLITPEYKASGACLNEMGAAWMMEGKTPVIPFILGLSHTDVGFIHNPTQHLQLDVKADLYKFVSDLKKMNLIKGDYDNGRLDTKLNEFIEIVQSSNSVKSEDVKTSVPKPSKTSGIKMTADTESIANKSAAFPVKVNRGTLEKIIKRLFAEKPKTGVFYQLNNQGEYYFFEDSQFHLIPDYETRCFLGWENTKGHVNIAIIDKYDLVKLTGDPMQSVFEMPVLKGEDLHIWILYRGRRHKVLNSKLIEKLAPKIKEVSSVELLAVQVGDQFQMAHY